MYRRVCHNILIPHLFLLFLLTNPAVADDPSTSDFLSDYLMQVDYVQKQILSLEGAVPAESFTWRPAEGVRSISEVYMHIAFANYGLLSFAGFQPPPDVADQIDRSYVNKWDASTTDKKVIEEKVTKSFDHVKKTVSGLSATDLEKKTDFFGQMMTTRNMLMTLLSHMHEHLGQSVAYARMNGIKPPWSQEPSEMK